MLFPERLKDYVRAELKLPLESVVVLKSGDEPMQRDAAIKVSVVLLGIVLVGLFWIVMRFRKKPTPPPLPPTMG